MAKLPSSKSGCSLSVGDAIKKVPTDSWGKPLLRFRERTAMIHRCLFGKTLEEWAITWGIFAVLNWGSYSNPGYLLYIRGIILPSYVGPWNGSLEGSLWTNHDLMECQYASCCRCSLDYPPTPQTLGIQSPYCQMMSKGCIITSKTKGI